MTNEEAENWQQQDYRNDGDITCENIGAVYNPYGVVVTQSAACECNQATPSRCPIGNVGDRLGLININGRNEESTTKDDSVNGNYFADSGLWLNGDYSIIGKILVVYSENYGDDIMACAPVRLRRQFGTRNNRRSTSHTEDKRIETV